MKFRALCITSILLLLVSVSVYAQKKLTVAFWNTENFFDTKNDTTVNDEEFLPDGPNKWTEERYTLKVTHLAEVIQSIGSNGPDFLGLCDIENRVVLNDLESGLAPKTGPYSIVHYDSPDVRGIDVAFLYKPSIYRLLTSRSVRIHIPDQPDYRTRDILVVQLAANPPVPKKGIKKAPLLAPDTITFLINHFPSRRFGKESEICRLYVAAQARKITDSLLAKNAFSKIVIMGDLNDEPNSESILSTLKAASSPDSLKPGRLLNVMGPLKAKGLGTYYFRGEFNMLDNLIISKGLLEPKSKFGLRYEANSAAVYKSDKIVEASGQYKGAPFRTYAGPNYKGGYSDHFPVFMQLSE